MRHTFRTLPMRDAIDEADSSLKATRKKIKEKDLIKMKKTNESQRSKNIFRTRSNDHLPVVNSRPPTAPRFPLKEVADLQGLPFNPVTTHSADVVSSSAKRYDENDKDKFELMNVKIVIYGLTGLVCENSPEKRQRFGGKREDTSEKDLGPTTAVVSCQKNGVSNQISFETFLPSIPLQRPTDTRLDKVRYAANWPSEQSVLKLQQGDGAMERSAFDITRCMKHNVFVPGMGARSNFCHETMELGINISRGTELIRLGTALLVFNGEEEGEVQMNIPTTPLVLNSKKLKKKKNKYGYFSNDTSQRYCLDENSILKVGVQVIPEEAVRFAREKDIKKTKKENEMNDLIEQEKLKNAIHNMGDGNIDHRGGIQIKSLTGTTGTSNGIIPSKKKSSNSLFPDIFCGSMPTSWVPNFFGRSQTEPEMPTEINTNSNIDQMGIPNIVSSISESTDGSGIQGK
ncbi:MAG: hypothetical protein ACI90V_012013 [Bacillariaceae sp.]|jgi:hypothetical protein